MTTDLTPSSGPTVGPAWDFYLKVTTHFVRAPQDRLVIERTYEFTRSQHIYEQVALFAIGLSIPGPLVLDTLK